MKAGEALAKLLEKVGVDVSEETLKSVVGITVDLPDEFFTKLDTELMGKDAAKVAFKKDIINDYTTGVYIAIEEDLKAMGLPKDQIDEAFKEKAFGKVIKNSLAKVAEFKEKATGTDKDKARAEEVKALNAQLAEIKEKTVAKEEFEKAKADWETEKRDTATEMHFLSKKWSSLYPTEHRAKLAKLALEDKLNEMGAKAVVIGKEIKIVKADDISSDYYDKSNKLVTFATLADNIMLSNKFLEVSPEASSTHSTTVTANQNGETNSKKVNTTQKLTDDLLKGYLE